jgi:hypothetical protein
MKKFNLFTAPLKDLLDNHEKYVENENEIIWCADVQIACENIEKVFKPGDILFTEEFVNNLGVTCGKLMTAYRDREGRKSGYFDISLSEFKIERNTMVSIYSMKENYTEK